MKLHTGWWKARDGSKWHVDYAGPSYACGHSEFGDVKCWDEFGETPEHDKDLISPWTEPKLRPWKSEEVPLGAWMRDKQSLRRYLIITDGIKDAHADWLSNYEHSTDGGKTWLPCGVEETK